MNNKLKKATDAVDRAEDMDEDTAPLSVPPNVKKVLEERGADYGDFRKQWGLSQALKSILIKELVHNPHFMGLPDLEKYALKEGVEQICLKLSRVAIGDCLKEDNFVDISGYSELLAQLARKK